MEFRILGPLEVDDGTGPVRIPGAKERALLADLLVHAGRVVSADRLIDDLWGDQPPGSPANTLQGRVSALRRALGPGAGLLVTRPPGYLLERTTSRSTRPGSSGWSPRPTVGGAGLARGPAAG